MDQIEKSINTIIKAFGYRSSEDLSTQAYRLFNGFYEGKPGLVIDRYGPAIVIMNHDQPGIFRVIIEELSGWISTNMQDIQAILLKERLSLDDSMKNGRLIDGRALPDCIDEASVKYALDLQLNQDAGFYIDTRLLRQWLYKNIKGRRVLNTFAYTGSLGVAAGAGQASSVVQTDLNMHFLNVAKISWELNGLNPSSLKFFAGDFFKIIGRMRQDDKLFDCVILDPPFFSDTSAGKIVLENDTVRLINKVRPLIAHGGKLVVVNNSLYLSGEEFFNDIRDLCTSEYLNFEKIIKIPEDMTGYPKTIVSSPPVDPYPFNHPTKIVVLHVTRKDQRV